MTASHKPDKNKVKKLEKEIREENSLWSKITQIHKKDKGFLSRLKEFLLKKPNRQKKHR
jgi:hypothetical protein